MITRIQVRDLAIVEKASVAFGEGLNIVTGETGAGKSVLIGAIDLLTGGRADHSIVRSGASSCSVEAEFALSDPAAVGAFLAEAGLPPCEDGLLLLRRTLSPTGAGRCYVNDAATTVHTLRALGRLLVDLHGPHDNQSLFDPAFQLDILDAFALHPAEREACAALFAERSSLLERRAALSRSDADTAREQDMLSFQVDEIRQAALSEDDGEPLRQRHADAANAANLAELGQQAMMLLNDAEPSVLQLLAELQRVLASMEATLGDEAREWHAEARSIAVQAQELARTVNDRISAIDASPEHLAALDARISLVRTLQRKYGPDIQSVLAFCDRAQERLDELASRADRLREIEAGLARLEARITPAAAALTKCRKAAAAKLSAAILEELRTLGFRDAMFEVAVNHAPFGPSGANAVEFGFAPNPGEPLRPLRDIASSGEIARVMLAVKTVLADLDRIPTLVFDEIDANIGGEIGNAVGEKMRSIGGKGHQVICITHLPQVASFGHSHTVVRKSVADGRTHVDIFPVDGDERVRELARMLGGESVTTVACEHARQLLQRRNKP